MADKKGVPRVPESTEQKKDEKIYGKRINYRRTIEEIDKENS